MFSCRHSKSMNWLNACTYSIAESGIRPSTSAGANTKFWWKRMNMYALLVVACGRWRFMVACGRWRVHLLDCGIRDPTEYIRRSEHEVLMKQNEHVRAACGSLLLVVASKLLILSKLLIVIAGRKRTFFAAVLTTAVTKSEVGVIYLINSCRAKGTSGKSIKAYYAKHFTWIMRK